MPLPIQHTVSASSKRSDGHYGSNEVFLSKTFMLLPGEDAEKVVQDTYLALKGQCEALLRMNPEEQGFTSAAEDESSTDRKPTAAEPIENDVLFTSRSGQQYLAMKKPPVKCPVCGGNIKETPDQYVPHELRDKYQVWQCSDRKCAWRGAIPIE